jgi:hypothetical protein
MCEFVDPVGQMFKTSEIEGAFDSDVEPLFGGGEQDDATADVDPVDADLDPLEV